MVDIAVKYKYSTERPPITRPAQMQDLDSIEITRSRIKCILQSVPGGSNLKVGSTGKGGRS